MSAVVIIPTTGADTVKRSIESVLSQTYPTTCYVVCDGNQFRGKVKVIVDNYLSNKNIRICFLPENVGANGFYGHRVYAAFSHLVNEDYVSFLDQDCWFEPNHIQSCVDTIQKNNLEWTYSLRKITDKEGKFLCNDDCESLGKWQAWTNTHHIDTNSYCVRRDVLIKLASVWHGGWGQDRVFLSNMTKFFPNFDCTNEYSVRYRVDGGKGSVNAEFFINGNEIMNKKYNGEFPWRKKTLSSAPSQIITITN
jgi:glycosyltransferase involved in cell wall biosynthesis